MSTADWHAPLWTNKQYMACELAVDYPVTYVESLGLRRPELTVRDLRRVISRLTTRGGQAGPSPSDARPTGSVRVVSPLVVPWHRFGTSTINRTQVRRSAADWLAGERSRRVLWTYTPTTYGLEREAAVVVYHCVDLLGAYPGIDRRVIERGEARLAAAGALAIASSREVAAHLRRVGFRTVLEWPNVADVEPFTAAARPAARRQGNLIVFGGNLSPHKFDTACIEAVLDRCPGTEVVLAGPIAEGGGTMWPGLAHVLSRGRVRTTGRLDLADLADLYGRAAVGVVPYVHNAYTRGVNPLKVNEYLAAGLPVVATALPSLDADDDGDLVLATDPDDFAIAVDKLLDAIDDESIARRQTKAADRSWTVRGRLARDFVATAVESGSLPRISRRARTVKRLTDVVAAAMLLATLSPLLVVTAAAVKLSSRGPVLYRHRRVGRNGLVFDVLKFRSMRCGTDAELAADATQLERYRRADFKLEADDPRITRVGRIIRAWSIDELPQLWNVLRGDMSIVGIRPLVPAELAQRPRHDQALYGLLPPGLTGLWQVGGRHDVVGDARFALDRTYVERFSLRRDLAIALRTPLVVLRRTGSS